MSSRMVAGSNPVAADQMKEDLDPPVNFDLERMKASLASGTITLPRGMSHEERREWLTKRLEEIDASAENEDL